MPREHNHAIPADTNALLDQIERARSELMQTINVPDRSPGVEIMALNIDGAIQMLMDRIIDEAQGVLPWPR